MSQAKEENLIVCLPTGSGKTYIAVMLIKEMSASTRKSIHDGGKRTVFLVRTGSFLNGNLFRMTDEVFFSVALVQQQSEYIATHTDLKIGRYYGELNVDFWNREKWTHEFEEHQVLVFTAQVFLDLLNHNHFRKSLRIQQNRIDGRSFSALHKVNLLIFDECHHYSGNNSYASLMNQHYDNCFEKPRILGLTASISAKKITAAQLPKAVKEIEVTFR